MWMSGWKRVLDRACDMVLFRRTGSLGCAVGGRMIPTEGVRERSVRYGAMDRNTLQEYCAESHGTNTLADEACGVARLLGKL